MPSFFEPPPRHWAGTSAVAFPFVVSLLLVFDATSPTGREVGILLYGMSAVALPFALSLLFVFDATSLSGREIGILRDAGANSTLPFKNTRGFVGVFLVGFAEETREASAKRNVLRSVSRLEANWFVRQRLPIISQTRDKRI